MAGGRDRITARAGGPCVSFMEREKAFKLLPGRHKGHAIVPEKKRSTRERKNNKGEEKRKREGGEGKTRFKSVRHDTTAD